MGEVETGVPIPDVKRYRQGRKRGELRGKVEKLSKSNIGDSLFVSEKSLGYVTSFMYREAGAGWFAARTVEGGCRVWKTSEPKINA